jgi:hypothetical protein
MPAIELTQPRVIVLEERGHTYKLTLRVLPQKAWLNYFEGIIDTSEMQDGKELRSFDASAPGTELVQRNLIAAEGYATADGSAITATPDWQQLIPLRHRLAAANVLTSVERADPLDDGPLVLGAEPVYLNAVWGADADGSMRKYQNLCHRFKTPTDAHQRRFSRDASRSRIIGGSRSGKTQWLGGRATLVVLYDELIESVDGYTVDGKPLDDPQEIARQMDTYHKVIAANQLFSPAMPKLSEEE